MNTKGKEYGIFMLEIKELFFSYDNENNIYENANLIINDNGIYYLDAPNGSGKSTLFKIFKNQLPFKRKILVDNNENFSNYITHIDYNLIIRQRLNLYDQIALFIDNQEDIIYYLKLFKLESLKQYKVKKLSDGERARFAF